mgnify:CR=1 FL=1
MRSTRRVRRRKASLAETGAELASNESLVGFDAEQQTLRKRQAARQKRPLRIGSNSKTKHKNARGKHRLSVSPSKRKQKGNGSCRKLDRLRQKQRGGSDFMKAGTFEEHVRRQRGLDEVQCVLVCPPTLNDHYPYTCFVVDNYRQGVHPRVST